MMLGLSLAPGDIAVRRAAGGGASLLPQTEAWLAALTTAGLDHPTAPHIAAVDTFYGSLISAGIYGSLDLLPAFFLESATPADSQGVALMDLIALQQWSAVNGPTFTPGAGFAGDGVAASVEWQHAAYNGLSNLSLNSASMGADRLTGAPTVRLLSAASDGGRAQVTYDGGVGGYILNDTTSAFGSAPAGGVVALDRPGAAGKRLYVNGSFASSDSVSSSQISSGFPSFFRRGPLFSDASSSFGFVGASLGDAGQLALYNAIQTLRAAVA